MTTRRDLLSLYLTGGVAALLVAGCTQQQIDDTQKKLADIINQVQQGVALACTSVGKIIPTANSVFAILVSIVGSSNVALATAEMIAQALAAIVAVGCPATPPSPTASATPRTTDKGIPIHFY